MLTLNPISFSIAVLFGLFFFQIIQTVHSSTISSFSTHQFTAPLQSISQHALIHTLNDQEFPYFIALSVEIDRPISRNTFFDSTQQWSQTTITTSFNARIGEALAGLTAAGGTTLPPLTQFRNRSSLISYIFCDEAAAANVWPYLGNPSGMRSVLFILNEARGDKSYEFESAVASQTVNYPQHCLNKIQDDDEMETDCGGSCIPCQGGSVCERDTDCTSQDCISIEDYPPSMPIQPPAGSEKVCRDKLSYAFAPSALGAICITLFVTLIGICF